jgi:hypothetical protein
MAAKSLARRGGAMLIVAIQAAMAFFAASKPADAGVFPAEVAGLMREG